ERVGGGGEGGGGGQAGRGTHRSRGVGGGTRGLVESLNSAEIDGLDVDPHQERTPSRTIIRPAEKDPPASGEHQATKLPVVEAIVCGVRPIPEFLRRVVLTPQQAVGTEVEDLLTRGSVKLLGARESETAPDFAALLPRFEV